ncbi:MurR/RpiR family transcriptional regulator [Telmatospirillum sp.]|uniref:MurR/RpiR family transcriptional regulator n=1 Tax=Telmatospirillum sp. TaxID=2079197 RepID=UPI002849114E|nr:MurR/RpiR family transcriptional regulator [Telmatospirillum sp.]MDR3439410.1 MurR/RpiR family transcriptional regulator [Telmatospirillum sp.]
MSDPLEQAIRDRYDDLPAGERKIADVLLELRSELAAYSATELAARAGVSKATTARLVRRLGYSDFLEMRQQARALWKNGSPLAELPQTLNQAGSLGRHLEQDLTCLSHTIGTLQPELADKAIDLLTKAGRLWVIGFRNSHALALYTRELLVQVKPDVRLLPVMGQTVAEELSSLTADDVILALGFRRRPPVLAKILRMAWQTGAPVVLVGDPSVGDLAKWAEVTIRCLNRGASLFDSYVSAISLLNFLCSGVALALGETAQQRLHASEQLHDEFGDFEL